MRCVDSEAALEADRSHVQVQFMPLYFVFLILQAMV
jgi:hypothetical protein